MPQWITWAKFQVKIKLMIIYIKLLHTFYIFLATVVSNSQEESVASWVNAPVSTVQ